MCLINRIKHFYLTLTIESHLHREGAMREYSCLVGVSTRECTVSEYCLRVCVYVLLCSCHVHVVSDDALPKATLDKY